jgi:hypothetical protein
LFVWPGASADQEHSPVWQSELPGEGPGDQICLIVAALAFPLRVKGYWDHEVGCHPLLAGEH